MAAESWPGALAEVLDLILFNVDKIVDDTSLEKLLEILEFIHNNSGENGVLTSDIILNFLNKIQVESSAAAISFAFRLTGVISSFCEGFSVLNGVEKGDRNILEYLFCEVLKNDEVWSDPGVRDSYFKAAIAILKSNKGFVWIQNSGVLQQSMSSLVDSSIFVTDTVREFFAKYLISLYNYSTVQHEETENILPDSTKHVCSRAETNTFSVDISVCYKCIIYHLKYLIEQSPSGLIRTMSIQVSISHLLLSLLEEDAIAAQEILHPSVIMLSCLKLLHYINKDECGGAIDVILTMLTNTSSWQMNWALLLDLKDKKYLFHTMLELILVLYKRLFIFHAFQLIQGLLSAGHFLQFEDYHFCSLFMLLTFPVHATLHKIEGEGRDVEEWIEKDKAKELLLKDCSSNEGYKTVHVILNETLNDFLSTTSVAQSLAVTTNVIQDVKLTSFPRLAGVVQTWCKDILEFLNQQSDDYFKRNSLTRLFIKAITVCIERDILQGFDATVFDGKKQSYRLFVKLLRLSQDSKILSSCFEGLKTLFSKADRDAFPSYVNENIGNTTLNQLISLHCLNSCWDVRDCVLNFLQNLVSTLDVDNVKLLLDHNVLLLLWKMMEDPESYVRASSVSLLGVLSSNDVIWKYFCETVSLSEEEVLNNILNAFEQEEAAFARRATIDVLTFWLERRLNVILMHIKENEISFSSTPVAKVLDKASQDFDWEVKLCVLNFWETLLHQYCGRNELHMSCIETSCLNGISKVILAALTDCDRPVRKKGLALLGEVKTYLVGVEDLVDQDDVLHYDGPPDDLQEFILHTKNDKKYSLFHTLVTIDFSEFAGNQESNSIPDPFSFLKDILAAASENEDNLLDCY